MSNESPLLTPARSSSLGSPAREDGAAEEESERPIRSQSLLHLPPVEPWPEPVDGEVLLEELSQPLRRVVVLPRWAEETLALFVLHSYAFELRDVSTYVGIESPEKRCGKTTLMIVLSELVNRPEVAANISSPAFYRMIEETQPTLFIDEVDTYLRGNAPLRGILNAGYSRKMAYVVRVANESVERGELGDERSRAKRPKSKVKGSRLARFSCWCPKVMATIGRLPDTLEDRCIVIRMQRKTPKEQCERLKNLEPVVTALRRKCARFVLDHGPEIARARPAIPASLNDRAADIWEPLLALADLAGGKWPAVARQAAAGLTARMQETNPIGALLLDLWILFLGSGVDRLFTHTLVARLNDLADRPWAEMRNGKEITDRWLAKQLNPYEVRPRTIRIKEVTAKGYVLEDFDEVFRRYIPASEVKAFLADSEGDAAGDQRSEVRDPGPEGGEEKTDAKAPRPKSEGPKNDGPGKPPGGESAAP